MQALFKNVMFATTFRKILIIDADNNNNDNNNNKIKNYRINFKNITCIVHPQGWWITILM